MRRFTLGTSFAAGIFALGCVDKPLTAPPAGRPQFELSAQGTAAPGYAVTDFATGFTDFNGVGPLGLAFDASGNLFVGNWATWFLYKFGAAGGSASPATQVNGTPNLQIPAGLTFGKDGSLFLARQLANDVVQLDPSDGTIIRTVASPIPFATGLATDPLSGDLFVSQPFVAFQILRISNFASGPVTVTPYATIMADGLAFGSDGTLFAAIWQPCCGVAVITGTNSATPGAVTIIDTPFGSIDGIAVSADPAAPFLYVNRNDGIITKIDLTTTPPTFTDIFTGGSRGDFAAVGPDGCLYATQTDRVLKVTNADGTCLPPPLGPLEPTNPTTPQQSLQALVNTVRSLVTETLVARGNGNALIAKLQAAIDELNVGNNPGATDDLEAFIHQLNALIRVGRVPAVQGQSLIDAANRIILAINTP